MKQNYKFVIWLIDIILNGKSQFEIDDLTILTDAIFRIMTQEGRPQTDCMERRLNYMIGFYLATSSLQGLDTTKIKEQLDHALAYLQAAGDDYEDVNTLRHYVQYTRDHDGVGMANFYAEPPAGIVQAPALVSELVPDKEQNIENQTSSNTSSGLLTDLFPKTETNKKRNNNNNDSDNENDNTKKRKNT